MLLTNLTVNDYVLGRTGLSLEPSDTLTVADDSYLADTDLRSDINTLYAASKISVSGGPVGFPVSAISLTVIDTHAAPADGEISAGEMAIWFDQTNGAGRLKVKAKTANGTVVTGTVALA